MTVDSATPAPPAAPPRLEVAGLTVTFGGITAVHDASFHVQPGQVVALIGPNGAGKTTIFNAICALVRRTHGSVRIDGHPAPSRPTALHRHGVARTLQGLGLFDGMTVLENVLVPVSGRANRTTAPQAAAQQLAALGLAHVAQTPVSALPYPDRKRVALARALVSDPGLVLLDEPAGGLDDQDIEDLARTVRRIAAEGRSVLLVEHHVDFVMDVADHIVVLDSGRVIAAGTPDEIRRDPLVEQAYLGVRSSS